MKLPKMPKVMNKKSNRGEYAREEGNVRGSAKKGVLSFVEGTKPNGVIPHKSLTPKAPMEKKDRKKGR